MRLCILAMMLTLIPWIVYAGEASVYTYTIETIFTNEGPESFTLEEYDLGLPAFWNSSTCTVALINCSHPFNVEFDLDGNPVYMPEFPTTLEAGETKTLKATYRIDSRPGSQPDYDAGEAETLDSVPGELAVKYCAPTETYASDSPRVAALAETLTASPTVMGKVLRVLDWFMVNTTYRGSEAPCPAEETAATKVGDCDDLTILFVSICRAAGIPAYMQVGAVFIDGYAVTEATWGGHLVYEAEGVTWHAWAMAYIPPWGWTPVDLTLTESLTPIDMITEAPYWRAGSLPAYNVSDRGYIREETWQRDRLMGSGVTVTSRNVSVKIGEESPEHWVSSLWVPLVAAGFLALYLIHKHGRGLRL
jgi:hypothetical protein